MRHDMDTRFYKEFIAYDAGEIMKMLAEKYGGEWDFDIHTDGRLKLVTIFNTTTVRDFKKGEVCDSELIWGPTCHSYTLRASTWIDLAENISSMRCFGLNI